MKRFWKITGLVVFILLLIIVLSNSLVRRSSYFNENYYKITKARIDSIRAGRTEVSEFVEAGFAKVSLTPVINDSNNYFEGQFRRFSLAGYGDRKGNPATGVHDSIFVKAVALRTIRETIVFVGADLLIMPPNLTDSVSSLLARKGIRRQQLVSSATHTHSRPGGWAPGFIGKQFAGQNKLASHWLTV